MARFGIAFLGFTDFERGALASYFRLAGARQPQFEHVHSLTDADYLVADADHPPSVQLVEATGRLGDTVFIGSTAPPDAVVWMPRPIDALQVTRALDVMAAQSGGARPPAAGWAEQPELEAEPAREPVPVPVPVHLAAPAETHRPEQAPVPSTPTRPPPAAPVQPRALVVDDSEIAQRFLETRLLPWGLVVDRAASSSAAIAMLQRHAYALVFLDVELGPSSELDGLALCQWVQQRALPGGGSAVVLVSAHHRELDRVRGALAGCDAYLAKPLDEAELSRLLLRHGLTPSGRNEPHRA